jgi:SpoVK/Ycf46/Vps4 family AAA+-type ATPase
VRRIKDALRIAKANGHALILLGCRLKLPPELEHEITHVNFSLPDPARLGSVLDGIIRSSKLKNVHALSVVETKGIDHKVVAREKARTLKKNGLFEVVEATTSLEDISGLGLLKDWLTRRAGAFSESAKTYGLPAPKGLLIVGIPGTGKSLTAKAAAGVSP